MKSQMWAALVRCCWTCVLAGQAWDSSDSFDASAGAVLTRSAACSPSGPTPCLMVLVPMWRNWLKTAVQSDPSWNICGGYCCR